jgi:membrane-associated phospholipid phosphatase
MPEDKCLNRSLFVIAVLIAIATVYGRYHYLADATCGAVIACTVPVVFVPARQPNAPSLPQIALSTRRASVFLVKR